MSNKWQVQEAKARFSELLETSLADGPQVVTKRGVESAVLVPIDQWRRLLSMTRPDLKELLLAPEARTDALTPPRRDLPRRAAPAFRIGPCISSIPTSSPSCAKTGRTKRSCTGSETYLPNTFTSLPLPSAKYRPESKSPADTILIRRTKSRNG